MAAFFITKKLWVRFTLRTYHSSFLGYIGIKRVWCLKYQMIFRGLELVSSVCVTHIQICQIFHCDVPCMEEICCIWHELLHFQQFHHFHQWSGSAGIMRFESFALFGTEVRACALCTGSAKNHQLKSFKKCFFSTIKQENLRFRLLPRKGEYHRSFRRGFAILPLLYFPEKSWFPSRVMAMLPDPLFAKNHEWKSSNFHTIVHILGQYQHQFCPWFISKFSIPFLERFQQENLTNRDLGWLWGGSCFQLSRVLLDLEWHLYFIVFFS